jgi:hypothetical protein
MRKGTMLLAALALGVAPGQANAGPQDIAATHAYISANHALAQASVAQIGAAQAKIERLNRALARECPLVGGGSPQNEASQPISYEVSVALWSLAYGINARAISTFVRSTASLRWSNRALTRAAQSYARNLHGFATLPLPNLCADVRAWKASGFQVVPATTTTLDLREQALELNPLSPRLLAPYERGADASLLTSTLRLEKAIEENEFEAGQTDWIQLLQTLGLSE